MVFSVFALPILETRLYRREERRVNVKQVKKVIRYSRQIITIMPCMSGEVVDRIERWCDSNFVKFIMLHLPYLILS